MKEKIIKSLNNYLLSPQVNTLTLFNNILEKLSQDKGQRAELESLIEQEQWLVQLSKTQNDGRVKSILDVFKHNGFKIPQAVASAENLLPFYAHPKNRAHLKLKDFLEHPDAPTLDEINSAHVPQVITRTTENDNPRNLSTVFKIASYFFAILTVVLIIVASVILPPLGIAAVATALIAVGLGAKGLSDENKMKQVAESSQQSISPQNKEQEAGAENTLLGTESLSARKEAEEQIKISKNERLLSAIGVSQQAKMMQQLAAKDKKMSASKEDKIASISQKTEAELREAGATSEQIQKALAQFTLDTPNHDVDMAYQSILSNVSRPILDAQDSDSEIKSRWQALGQAQRENMSLLEDHLDCGDYKEAAEVLKTFSLDVRQNIGMYFKPGSGTIERLKSAMLDKTFREVRTGKDIAATAAENPQETRAEREEPRDSPARGV